MPRASADAAARTAQEVLSTATELFAAHGVTDVSLESVAQQAGVTRGAVYHHYGSKEGLFRAVAVHLQATVARAVSAAADEAGGDASTQLTAGCHAFLNAITAAPVVRILLIDAPAVIGWAEWRQMDAENSVAHLREGLLAAGVEDDLLEPVTAQLSGAMNEAALWLAQRPKDSNALRAAHYTLDLLLRAVVR